MTDAHAEAAPALVPRRPWRNPLTVAGALILALVALSATLAPVLAVPDPLQMNPQRLLEHPKDLEPREPIRRYGSLLRLWHFPAFGPQVTWTILKPGKKAAANALPMAREVTWDRAADHLRVFDAPVVVKPGSAEIGRAHV